MIVVRDPHPAIGTSALAVAISASAYLIPHARAGHVRWKVALTFYATNVVGAFVGSSIGKVVDGQHLRILLALLMRMVAARPPRGSRGEPEGHPLRHTYPRLGGVGLGAGALSGFSAMGSGFLIVPALMFASGTQFICAMGTSLFTVGVFGLTAAASQAVSGLTDWPVAVELFIGGGIVGGWLGAMGAQRLAKTPQCAQPDLRAGDA